MGREMRMVPADWQHPKKDNGRYQPMHDSTFSEAAKAWKNEFSKWEAGERPDYCSEESKGLEFWEWSGDPPDRDYYFPEWPAESRTHFQMYESTSEGTPISPVFADIESLAHWLADSGASAFGSMTATYEDWLATCKRGWAPSGVFTADSGLVSGVEGLANITKREPTP